MPVTTLLGLSFGVFPCLLFGFIMLLSLLICEYIEEYVAKHLCAWKNRRRRGLRSFYRDFRDRRSIHNNPAMAQHYTSSRTRSYQSSSWVGPVGVSGSGFDPRSNGEGGGNLPLSPTAPPGDRSALYGIPSGSGYPNYPMLPPLDDSPPSYEECVLPRVRLQQSGFVNENSGVSANVSSRNPNANASRKSKSAMKKSSSMEKDKEKD